MMKPKVTKTGATKTRQEEREDEADERLNNVRKTWNKSRLHHRLRVAAPDFERVACLSLPLIEREPLFKLPEVKKSTSKWKKTKTMIRLGGMVSKKDSGDGAKTGRRTNRSTRDSKTLPRSTPQAELLNFFSPLKKAPSALNMLMESMAKDAQDEPMQKETAPEVAFVSKKPKSAMDALNELKGLRNASTPIKTKKKGKPPNLSPSDIKTPSMRNLPMLTPKEKTVQLKNRVGKIEDLMLELDEKPSMTLEEINKIISFMDFNGSGEVDETEFTNAVRAAKRGLIKDEDITRLMSKVDNELRIKQIRLSDLFKRFDTSGDGSLSVQELQFGLNMLCDVSYETQCERRRLKREAAHDRWKDKESVRDKAKMWLTEVESLPEEFVLDREFFCRDIKTPERFEKFLQVVINGPILSKSAEQKLKEAEDKRRGKEKSITAFHFDLDKLDEEDVRNTVMKIVDEEMSIASASLKKLEREAKDAFAAQQRGQSRGEEALADDRRSDAMQFRPDSYYDDDDENSLGGSSIGENSMGDMGETNSANDESSVGSLSIDESLGESSFGGTTLASYDTYNTLESGSQYTIDSQVSSASVVLGQIRKARGQKEIADVEMESLIMLLGNGKSTLASIKQRHFEERMFRNLYQERTHSLSNDYYLPGPVLEVLEREEALKSLPKARGVAILEEEGRLERERYAQRLGMNFGSPPKREGSPTHAKLKSAKEVAALLSLEQKELEMKVIKGDDSDYEDEDDVLFDIPVEINVE
jgi:hypothetical protein